MMHFDFNKHKQDYQKANHLSDEAIKKECSRSFVTKGSSKWSIKVSARREYEDAWGEDHSHLADLPQGY